MKKDPLEKEMEEREPIDFVFSDISSKITLDSYVKPQKKKRWGWIFGGGAGVLSAGCALALCIFFFRPFPSSAPSLSSSLGTPSSSNDHISEADAAQAITIQNPEELVTEYEKNCAFIGDGVLLGKTQKDGKKKFVAPEDYLIDSSAFRSGEVGTYPIVLSLKSDPTIRASYQTQVIDDTVTGVSLGDYQEVYYLGEMPRPQDLVLNKTCQSGAIKEAKPAEYEIGTFLFNPKAVGRYTLTVKLKSNVSFSLTYNVEVKPLIEADLEGRYAYLDEETEYGYPTIYAFEIVQGRLTSHYSEIGNAENLIRTINSDGTMLLAENGAQRMIYLPALRTLRVSGIAGDPDMDCFRLNRTDFLISLVGAPENESGTRYVAIDERIPTSTLNYLAYRFGGSYRDLEMTMPITHDSLFSGDATVYVGVKPSVNVAKPFVGIWYREDAPRYRQVAFQIAETGLSIGYGATTTDYSVEEKANGDYWLRADQVDNLVYHSKGDLLDILNPETGKTYISLRRYNKSVQSLIQIVAISRTIYAYIVDKGSSLPTLFIGESSLMYFKFSNNDYHGEPLYQDATFQGVYICSQYLSDIEGLYGTLANHVQVVGSFAADRFPSPHTDWCEFTENYLLVRSGWVGYGECEPLRGVFGLVVHYDDGSEERLTYTKSTNTLQSATMVAKANATPWKDLPCLGRYAADDGSVCLAMANGFLGIYQEHPSGGSSTTYITTRITRVSTAEIKGYTITEDVLGYRIVKEVRFELKDSGWVLTYDGVAYVWKGAE